jgi:hypothetical protein
VLLPSVHDLAKAPIWIVSTFVHLRLVIPDVSYVAISGPSASYWITPALPFKALSNSRYLPQYLLRSQTILVRPQKGLRQGHDHRVNLLCIT